jgi:hypothetical protein
MLASVASEQDPETLAEAIVARELRAADVETERVAEARRVEVRREDAAGVLRAEERARARELGIAEGLQQAHNAETVAHFRAINGSQEKVAERLGKLEAAVTLLPANIRESISAALDKREKDSGTEKFTSRQTIFAAVGMLVLVGGFLLGVYTALHK